MTKRTEWLMPKSLFLLIVLFLCVTTTTVQSKIVKVFNDRTSMENFLNKNGIPYVYENCYGIPTGAQPYLWFMNGTDFGCYISADYDNLYNIPGVLSTNYPNVNIIFNFSSSEVYYFGGSFTNTDFSFNDLNGQILVLFSDGSQHIIDPASYSRFVGFFTSVPISSVIIRPTNSTTSYVAANDFLIGSGPHELPLSNWTIIFTILIMITTTILLLRKNTR